MAVVSGETAKMTRDLMIEMFIPQAVALYMRFFSEDSDLRSEVQWFAGHLLAHPENTHRARDLKRVSHRDAKHVKAAMDMLAAMRWVREIATNRLDAWAWEVNPQGIKTSENRHNCHPMKCAFLPLNPQQNCQLSQLSLACAKIQFAFFVLISHGLIDCDLNKNVLPRGDSCDSCRLPAVFRRCFMKIIWCQLRQSATRPLFRCAISRNWTAAPYTDHSGRPAISSEQDGILPSHRLAGLLEVNREKGVGAGVADTVLKIRPRTNLR